MPIIIFSNEIKQFQWNYNYQNGTVHLQKMVLELNSYLAIDTQTSKKTGQQTWYWTENKYSAAFEKALKMLL